MHPTLTLAMRAAEAAAEKLVYTRDNWERLCTDSSPDKAIQELRHGAGKRIIGTLRNAYPDQTIYLAHQGDSPEDPEAIHWRAEVLLGEFNFRRGLPDTGVLLSQWQRGRMEHLALVFPFLDLRAVASRGRGMQVGDRRVRCAPADRLPEALFGHSPGLETAPELVRQGLIPRITGCPVLDVVQVASGSLDACAQEHVEPLDMAAAQLLATESGGMTGDRSGAPLQRRTHSLLMANPRLFRQLVNHLRKV